MCRIFTCAVLSHSEKTSPCFIWINIISRDCLKSVLATPILYTYNIFFWLIFWYLFFYPHTSRDSVSPLNADMKNIKILPQQDFLYANFTQKCVNYATFTIVSKHRKLPTITMYTKFTSFHMVYLYLARLGSFTQACEILEKNIFIKHTRDYLCHLRPKICINSPKFYSNSKNTLSVLFLLWTFSMTA